MDDLVGTLTFDKEPKRCRNHHLSVQTVHDILHLFFEGFDAFVLGFVFRLHGVDFLLLLGNDADQSVFRVAGIGAALAELEADAGVEHVFPAAQAGSDGEENVVRRPIEGADRDGIGRFVITVAGCKVTLRAWIVVQRMEGCQGCCPGTDAVDARIEVADPTVLVGHVI